MVLMMENRAFDHMVGFLQKYNSDVDGCLPKDVKCSNHLSALDPTSPLFIADETAVYSQTGPNHEIYGTTEEICTCQLNHRYYQMCGFAQNYARYFSDPMTGGNIMKCFSRENVPAISALADEFALFDGFFSSVPGPTEPNRAYAISATSHGMGYNDPEVMIRGLPQKTIMRQLREMGRDWRIYFEQVPAAVMFKDLRHKEARQRYHVLHQLYADLAAGDLPEYSWIEPAYFDTAIAPARDQHPDHDVTALFQ